MKDIIEEIRKSKDVIHGKEVSDDEISIAESKLHLKFSDDYRLYIKAFGCMAIGSREFTGISTITNYDVVSVTLSQREYNEHIPQDWYVIEQLHIDSIVIWQSSTGEIYQTSPYSKPQKISNTLSEYISP